MSRLLCKGKGAQEYYKSIPENFKISLDFSVIPPILRADMKTPTEKKRKKRIVTKKLTLQHTREGTYWPDIEQCTETGDIITVKDTQVASSTEYKVTERKENGCVKSMIATNTGETFNLAYNPSLQRYYVRSTDPNKPFCTPQHMCGHRAFFHEESKTVIWMVPRNGSCTILASLLYAEGGEEIKMERKQPALIWGYTGQREHFVDILSDAMPNPDKWSAYRHCIVYQDPMYKCIRHMNYIMSCNKPQLQTFFSECPEKIKDMKTFADTYLAIAEINKYNNKHYYEQHMIPQMFYHKTLPVTPDVIIDLEDLSPFIRKEMRIQPITANIETSIGISLMSITKEQKARIMEIYGDDYKIEQRFKDRWWYE